MAAKHLVLLFSQALAPLLVGQFDRLRVVGIHANNVTQVA